MFRILDVIIFIVHTGYRVSPKNGDWWRCFPYTPLHHVYCATEGYVHSNISTILAWQLYRI